MFTLNRNIQSKAENEIQLQDCSIRYCFYFYASSRKFFSVYGDTIKDPEHNINMF